MIPVNDLRQGVTFIYEGKTYQVVSFRRHKQARAKAVVNVTARDLENGGIQEITFKSSDSVDEAALEYKEFTFVYFDDRRGKVIFSDLETNKRIEMEANLLNEGSVRYLREGAVVRVMLGQDDNHQPVYYSIVLPNTVELTVTEAPPNEKGDTSSGGTKPVTMETGLVVNTPFFISAGDTIKVNTQTGEYIERV